MTNRNLPVLNPLKARSTIAAGLALLSVFAPMLGGGVGEVAADVVANGDAIQQGAQTFVNAVNVAIGVVGVAWFWFERRAPNFRLSFAGRT
jgi:hypothetical protein